MDLSNEIIYIKKVACMWEPEDRGMRKIIIFIIIKDMHVECVSGG